MLGFHSILFYHKVSICVAALFIRLFFYLFIYLLLFLFIYCFFVVGSSFCRLKTFLLGFHNILLSQGLYLCAWLLYLFIYLFIYLFNLFIYFVLGS